MLHEGLAGAPQLEARQHSSFRGHRADQDARRTPAPGEAADRLRQIVVLGQLFRADLSLRDARAFELGAERRGCSPHPTRLQLFSAALGRADDRKRGADARRGCFSQHTEGAVQILCVQEVLARRCERPESPPRDLLSGRNHATSVGGSDLFE